MSFPCQVLQTPEPVVTVAEPEFADAQVFLTLPEVQGTKVEHSW